MKPDNHYRQKSISFEYYRMRSKRKQGRSILQEQLQKAIVLEAKIVTAIRKGGSEGRRQGISLVGR